MALAQPSPNKGCKRRVSRPGEARVRGVPAAGADAKMVASRRATAPDEWETDSANNVRSFSRILATRFENGWREVVGGPRTHFKEGESVIEIGARESWWWRLRIAWAACKALSTIFIVAVDAISFPWISSGEDKNDDDDDDDDMTNDGVLTPLLDSLVVVVAAIVGPKLDAVLDRGVVGVADVEFSRFRWWFFIFVADVKADEVEKCASPGWRGVRTAIASRAATIGRSFSNRDDGINSCMGNKRGRVIDWVMLKLDSSVSIFVTVFFLVAVDEEEEFENVLDDKEDEEEEEEEERSIEGAVVVGDTATASLDNFVGVIDEFISAVVSCSCRTSWAMADAFRSSRDAEYDSSAWTRSSLEILTFPHALSSAIGS